MAGYTAPTYDPSAALQLQAEYEAAQEAYNNNRLNNLEIPQLGFTAVNDSTRNLIDAGQLGLTQSDDALKYLLGSGQLGLQQYQAGLQGLENGSNLGLTQQDDAMKYLLGGGQLGLQQQNDQQGALQSAANAYSGEALDAMKLAASLTGPANAFQQQAVLEGMNNAGLSRGVGAIAGQYSLPTFQAPQAAPEAASLGTLAQQFDQAGGGYAGMTPTQIAFASAQRAAQGAPSYAAPTMGAAYNLMNGPQFGSGVVGASNQLMNGPSYAGETDAAARQLLTGPSYAAPGMGAAQQMFNAASQFDNGVGAKGSPTGMSGQPGQQSFGPFGGWQFPQGAQTGGAPGVGRYAMRAPGFGYGQPGAGYGGYGSLGAASPRRMGPGGYGAPGFGYGAPSGGYGQQPGYRTSASAYGSALPNLNQINAKNWMQMPTSTQQFMTSAYEGNGYSKQDVDEAVKNNLPQFKSPSFGLVGA